MDRTDPDQNLHALLGIWTWNVKTGIVVACGDVCAYVNIPAETGIHGVPAERFLAAIHPDDRGELQRRVDEALGGAEIFMANYRVMSDQHGTVWVRSSGHCFRDQFGNPTHVSGYLTRIEGTALAEVDEQTTLTAVVQHLSDAREAAATLPRPTLLKLISAVMLEASFQLADVLKRH